jgi:hypothetical protein
VRKLHVHIRGLASGFPKYSASETRYGGDSGKWERSIVFRSSLRAVLIMERVISHSVARNN